MTMYYGAYITVKFSQTRNIFLNSHVTVELRRTHVPRNSRREAPGSPFHWFTLSIQQYLVHATHSADKKARGPSDNVTRLRQQGR